MAEVTDYTKYLPTQPPESVIKEIREGYFTQEYLIYKMDSYYDPLEDRVKRAVRCTCTACGGSVYLDKVPGRICCYGAGMTTYGFFNPRTDFEVFDQDETSCPNCGEPVKVLHSSHFSNNSYGSIYQTEYPVTVHNIEGGLALLYWEVRRYIDKDARQTVITLPYDGYIFFKKKKICVTGREQAYFQKRYLYQWKQLKRYRVDVGRSVGEDIFFIDPLDGSEAENCKLDMYCDTDAEVFPVRYMELWQKYPNIENLVMQGFGEYVNNLMQSCVQYTSYYTRSFCDIKQMAKELDLKKTKPHEILGISKEELRAIRAKQFNSDEIDYYRMARNMGVTTDTLRKATEQCARFIIERLYQYGADLFKILRYIKKQQKKYPKDDVNLVTLADYWEMARDNGEDMTRNDVMFPQRLKNAHDTAVREKKWKQDEALKAKFAKRYKELERYCYSSKGLSIHPAQDESEMITEGKLLTHCVARYAKSHAEGRTTIFFIRHEDAPNTPYFTLEFNFESMRVVQNRGYDNCGRTPEVEAFEKKWVKFVKQIAAKERKAA